MIEFLPVHIDGRQATGRTGKIERARRSATVFGHGDSSAAFSGPVDRTRATTLRAPRGLVVIIDSDAVADAVARLDTGGNFAGRTGIVSQA